MSSIRLYNGEILLYDGYVALGDCCYCVSFSDWPTNGQSWIVCENANCVYTPSGKGWTCKAEHCGGFGGEPSCISPVAILLEIGWNGSAYEIFVTREIYDDVVHAGCQLLGVSYYSATQAAPFPDCFCLSQIDVPDRDRAGEYVRIVGACADYCTVAPPTTCAGDCTFDCTDLGGGVYEWTQSGDTCASGCVCRDPVTDPYGCDAQEGDCDAAAVGRSCQVGCIAS